MNPGYALERLLEALRRGPAGAARAERWKAVVDGLWMGTLRPGSRTPVDAPPWVTLEVLTGGFATGKFLAGGELRAHERELDANYVRASRSRERRGLNTWFLTDNGNAWLHDRLETGCYRIDVPEEGALLAIAWLLSKGEGERAEAILSTIEPWAHLLRFYPVPAERPRARGVVSLRTTGDVVRTLKGVRRQPQVASMKEALEVWAPRAANAVALFMEPEAPDWKERARALLADYEQTRASSRLCKKVDDPKENYARLRALAKKALTAPLSEGELRTVSKIVTTYVAKHGAPGTPEHASRHQLALESVRGPLHVELARELAARLEQLPQDEGLADPEQHLAGMPAQLSDKVRVALEAPVERLVERRIVQSTEVLATLLPKSVAETRAEGISDSQLQTLYVELYTAFRRRRSLLLLNLESQVRFDELPWVSALRPWLDESSARAGTRSLLARVVSISLRSFPEAITPNKLVKEIRELATSAGLELPLVEELAADIFMGAFTPTFLESAHAAARLLGGTPYERYYALPFAEVLQLRSKAGARDVPEFMALCTRLASPPTGQGSAAARNGTILEQAQLLTTHNLAVLIDALGLRSELDWRSLAMTCFTWVCARQRRLPAPWGARLRVLKNSAYAWRQMLVFLSLASPAERSTFLEDATAHFDGQPHPFRRRFRPALAGLRAVLRGAPVDSDGGRRFLGWTVGPHWLLS